MISAAFKVNGASNPAAHSVSYGSTVSLELLSFSGVNNISWQIVACSDPSYAIPAVTISGTPPGRLASFVFPSDPGDDYGRTFLVKCTVSSNVAGTSGTLTTSEQYAVIGVPNIRALIPIVPGEQNYRDATHGWSPEINIALANSAGAPPDPITGSGQIAVDLFTTSNITLSGLAQTIQGVLVNDPSMRILTAGQTDGTKATIWNPSSGAWNLDPDFNSSDEYVPGMGGKVLRGTYAGASWSLSTIGSIVLGTTPLSYNLEPFVDTTGQSDKVVVVASGVTALSKIGNNHIDNATLSVSKLLGTVPDAGKVPLVQPDGSIALSLPPSGVQTKTPLNVALTARSYLRAYDQAITDDGTNINFAPLTRIPRVMVKGVRVDNITDFEQVTITANGFTLVRGDVFEARSQTNTANNGLYYVGRIMSSLDGKAWCYRLSSLEELAADGGLRVYIRSGNTDAGTVQLVTNFTTGARVQQPFTGLRYNEVDIEDFALSSEDMSTNCEPAWRRAQEALSYSGGEVRFRQRQNYKSTSTFYIKRRIGIRGTGSHSTANGTVIEFVACAGMWAQLQFDMRRSCRVLDTSGGARTGLGPVDGVTLVDGDRILRATSGGNANDGFWVAHAGAWTRPTDFDTTAEVDPACRTFIKAGTHAGEAWELITPDPIVLGTTPIQFVQATVWVGHEDTIAAQVPISDITLVQTGTPANLDTAGGIIARTSVCCTNVMVSSFSGHGFDCYASTNAIPASTNNGSQFTRCWAQGNGLNGFLFKGADANQSWVIGCNASTNGQRAVLDSDWGFCDESFLGNQFFSCQAATNGGAYKAVGVSQASTFTGCYEEADNHSDVSSPSMTFNCRIGLRSGGGYTPISVMIPGIIRSTDVMLLSSYRITGPTAVAPGVAIKRLVNSNYVEEFATQAGGGDTSGYTLKWNPSGGDGLTNTWAWCHNATNSRWSMFLTGPSHGRSYAMTGFPHGALIGGAAGSFWKLHSVGTVADLPAANSTATGSTNRWEGVYANGDVMWNSGWVAGTGLPNHWACTNTAGTLTWQPVWTANDSAVNLTNQGAAITSTALLTAPAAGLYEIDYYLCCTTADAAASAVQLTVSHTDGAGSTSQTSASLVATTTGRDRGRLLVEVASGNVNYSVSWATPGTAKFSLKLRAKRVS